VALTGHRIILTVGDFICRRFDCNPSEARSFKAPWSEVTDPTELSFLVPADHNVHTESIYIHSVRVRKISRFVGWHTVFVNRYNVDQLRTNATYTRWLRRFAVLCLLLPCTHAAKRKLVLYSVPLGCGQCLVIHHRMCPIRAAPRENLNGHRNTP